MRTKHCFNMVEILLALGVCAIGVCSIMVLFPVGAAATRDAAMETYAAHAADQMLHLLRYQMTSTAVTWSDKIGSSSLLPETNPATVLENQALAPDDSDWAGTAEPEMNTIFSHSKDGIYQIISDRETAAPSLSSAKVDFRAIMFVWWSPISILISGTDKNENIGVTLNVEVTWPAELPYASRQKANYSLEVFNPN